MKKPRYQPTTRVVPREDEWLAREKLNPMARGLDSAFRRIFERDILPKKEFEPGTRPLYTPSRTWIDQSTPPQPPASLPGHQYEERLYQQFWDTEGGTLVLIEGFPGCGKSTLMTYFFRGYCAQHPMKGTDHTDIKLFLNIDLATASSPEGFDKLFYERVQERIVRACDASGYAIETDCNYSMWDSIFRWNSPVHGDAERSRPDQAAYRGNLVTGHPAYTDPKRWCEAALTFITAALDGHFPGSSVPFSKVVLCLDNLDQCPIEVQLHALLLVKRWLEADSHIRFWRAFVPLWPATLRNITPRVEPLPPGTTTIQLGPIDPLEFLSLRARALREEITSIQAETGITEIPADSPEDCITLDDANLVVAEALERVKDPYKFIVAGISGGSARQQLNLWQITLSSQSVFDTARASGADSLVTRIQSRQSADLRINPSPLIDGLLTGRYLAHNRERSPIINLFAVAPEEPSNCYDLLLGLHVLHLIGTLGVTDRSKVREPMEKLGYEAIAVKRCLLAFGSARVLNWLLDTETRDGPFLVTQSAVAGYMKLLSEKVYIDNMAITTPISRSALSKMKRTRHTNPDQFIDRMNTSLQFLLQLADAEEDFCDPEVGENRSPEWAQTLAALQLPCWSRELANSYRRHVEAIQPNVYGQLAQRLQQAMSTIDNHDLFVRTKLYPRTLTPRLASAS